jgi:methionyl-tRNA formyltransferase
MALIWMELHAMESDPSLLSAACKALDLVKRAQPMSHPNDGVRGGIAGSDPLWGDYIELAFPNWAAKFFIDAMLEKRRAIAALRVPAASESTGVAMPDGVPTTLRPVTAPFEGPAPSVVLLALDRSPKVEQFIEAWASWGFVPSAVVIPRAVSPSRVARLRTHVESLGFRGLARRALGLPSSAPPDVARHGTIATSGMSVSDYCGSRGIRVLTLDTLDAPRDVATLRELHADVFVYAGCGIMRAATLAIPRLGTLNAHMGLLPPMRGMNVAEWSIMYGVPVGCSVHLIDPGIDTGDILLFRPVDITGAEHVDAMRHRVDRAQIEALGEVLRWTVQSGALPPRRAQRPDEGRQYFSMHDDVRDVLQRVLRQRL